MKLATHSLALCLGLSACHASGSRWEVSPSVGNATAKSVVLYVTNQHFEDVRLYLLRGSTRIPIGTVGSFTARRFVIPPAEVGSNGTLEVVAQSLASTDVVKPDAIDIAPGAEVEFRIENNLSYSRLVPRVYRPR